MKSAMLAPYRHRHCHARCGVSWRMRWGRAGWPAAVERPLPSADPDAAEGTNESPPQAFLPSPEALLAVVNARDEHPRSALHKARENREPIRKPGCCLSEEDHRWAE